MKQKIATILLSIIILLCGCDANIQGTAKGAVKFYYLRSNIAYNSSNSVVSYEVKQSKNLTQEELINQYLLGPQKKDLISPFPANLRLVSITQQDNNVAIVFSGELANLSGHALTLACSCIAKTMEGILPADTYEISSAEGKLNGKSSVSVTPNSFIWEDTLPKS